MKKKVLLIHSPYHDYSDRIIKALKSLDYELKVFSLKPKLNIFELLINYITKNKYYSKKSYLIQKQLNQIPENDFDYVFVLNTRFLDKEIIKSLKNKYNKAKFILYLWDDIIRAGKIINEITYFDYIYTSDKNDSVKHNFIFLPLFYSKDFLEYDLNKKYDLLFIGGCHSNRINLLKKIIRFQKEKKLNLKAYLLINYWGYLKRFIFYDFFRKNNEFFICNNISLKDFANYLCHSKACIDMQHDSQTGLTMRCIESLPAHCKIITTNEHIKEYDFYCPENVMIIDRDNPVFDVDFIKSPYKPIPKEIVEKYSLENWIKTIFRE